MRGLWPALALHRGTEGDDMLTHCTCLTARGEHLPTCPIWQVAEARRVVKIERAISDFWEARAEVLQRRYEALRKERRGKSYEIIRGLQKQLSEAWHRNRELEDLIRAFGADLNACPKEVRSQFAGWQRAVETIRNVMGGL